MMIFDVTRVKMTRKGFAAIAALCLCNLWLRNDPSSSGPWGLLRTAPRLLSGRPAPSIDDLLSGNPLYKALDGADSSPPAPGSKFTAVLWDIPPVYVGGITAVNAIDKCFHLTGERAVRENGKFTTRGDYTVLPNVLDAPAVLKEAEDVGSPKMFAFFLHPVDRAVYLIKQLQSNRRDPHYDPNLAQLDLSAYLNFMKTDWNSKHLHHYRISNWIVRSLVKKTRFEALTLDDVAVATEIIRAKFVPGLFKEMEENMFYLKDHFGWDMPEWNRCDDVADEDACRKNAAFRCLNQAGMGRSSLHRKTLDESSMEYNILTEMNEYDIALFENVEMMVWEARSKDARARGELTPDRPMSMRFLADSSDSSEGLPALFIAPPYSSVKDVDTVLDLCFDMTRSTIVGTDGSHEVHFQSIRRQIEQINNEQDIPERSGDADLVVFSKFESLPKFLKRRRLLDPTSPDRAKVFTALVHPVVRAVHMSEYLKRTGRDDPFHDPRVVHMDVFSHLKFLQQEGNENHLHRYRMSDWLTRSLSNAPRDKTLDQNDLNVATRVLQDHFVVGFYDDMEESLRRFAAAFGWEYYDKGDCREATSDLTRVFIDKMKRYGWEHFGEQRDTNQTLSDIMTTFMDENLFSGRKMLEAMNRWDIKLFKRAKLIFKDQTIRFG